jgi:protease-4
MKHILLLITFVLLTSCITIPINNSLRPFEETILHDGDDEKILILDISGIIIDSRPTNVFGSPTEINITARIREQLEKAEDDPDIKGLILKIDSPGGAVTASDIIHHEIMRYKKRTGIYTIAQMESVAASGGYYIAAAADEISAYPTTITGSIGVIITMVNIEGLLENIGVENETIASGDAKQMGSFLKKMSNEEKALFQQIVTSLYERFLSVVLEGRPDLDRKSLLKVADGRVILAQEAKNAGLIDHVQYWDETLTLMKNKIGVTDPTIVTYTRPGRYTPNIYSNSNIKSGTEHLIPGSSSLFQSKYGISFMYLWKP